MYEESASEAMVVNGVAISSEIDPSEVEESLSGELGQRLEWMHPQVKRALAMWAEDMQPNYPVSHRRDTSKAGYWPRDRYETPGRIFEQMALSYQALDDDIVGAVADTSEAIAFQKVSFQCEDEDQNDVWNQIGRDLNLDNFLRVAWRELLTCSQFYAVRHWGTKEYRVRGDGEQRSRRKTFRLKVPTELGFLDPTRIVPVLSDIFGNARLCWIASDWEGEQWDKELPTGRGITSQLIEGRYKPTKKEIDDLQKEGIPTDNLWLLSDKMVFRHTLTRSSYERWAKIRMKGIFPLLDLKAHLREMDRAWLRGGINFIVLVTRGTDEKPTNAAEVANTTELMRTHSRSPVIVSDHRISIEIITPDVTAVLDKSKWTVLDERIMMRMWGTFQLPSETSNRETSITLGRVIARGLASRRHMLKRTIEKELIRAVGNANEGKFDESCSLEFAPRQMDLQLDPALITLIQELRDRGDLSRETVLTEFNFNQQMEAHNREVEDEKYGDVFKPVNVPFDSPNKTTPGGSGRTGGRPPGQPQPEQPAPTRPPGER